MPRFDLYDRRPRKAHLRRSLNLPRLIIWSLTGLIAALWTLRQLSI